MAVRDEQIQMANDLLRLVQIAQRWNARWRKRHLSGYTAAETIGDWGQSRSEVIQAAARIRQLVTNGADRWIHGPLGTTPGSWTTRLQLHLSGYERRFAVTCPANENRCAGTRKGFEEAVQAIHEMLRQIRSLDLSAIAAERSSGQQDRVGCSSPPDSEASSSSRRRRGMRSKEANAKAWAYLNDNPNAKAREVATGIGCSLGTVPKLAAWKFANERRRMVSGGRKPTIVNLSSKMEALTGAEDKILEQLIAESQADNELSPLVDDPQERIERRKARVYARR